MKRKKEAKNKNKGDGVGEKTAGVRRRRKSREKWEVKGAEKPTEEVGNEWSRGKVI